MEPLSEAYPKNFFSAFENHCQAIATIALREAVIIGDIIPVEQALKQGAVIDYKDQYEVTPLIYATIFRYEKIVITLLKHGANPNTSNILNQTPLMFAIKEDSMPKCIEEILPVKYQIPNPASFNIMCALINYNANIDAIDIMGNTVTNYTSNLQTLSKLYDFSYRVKYLRTLQLLTFIDDNEKELNSIIGADSHKLIDWND